MISGGSFHAHQFLVNLIMIMLFIINSYYASCTLLNMRSNWEQALQRIFENPHWFSLYKLEFVRSGHHLLILMQSYLNSILLDVAHIEMMSSKESDFGFGWG